MSDAKGLIFDINENEIMSHIEDGTLSQFLKSWRNAQLIKLAKEPQEEPNIPLECVDGSCPIALSEEYEEWGMDVVHSCAECPYQPQVQQIVRTPEEITEEVQDIVDFEYSVHGGFDKYDKMNSMISGKQNEKAREEFKRKPYGGVQCRTGDQQKESEL